MREFGWFSIFFRGCNHDKSVHIFPRQRYEKFQCANETMCQLNLKGGHSLCSLVKSFSAFTRLYDTAFTPPRMHEVHVFTSPRLHA